MALIFWDFTGEWDYIDYTSTQYNVPEPSRIKKKKANIFIRLKWLMMILMWKFKNRKWNKCRQKIRSLDRYKYELMKGYRV